MKRRGTVSFSIGSLISILLVIIIFSILLVFHGKIISFLKNIFKSHRTIEQEVIDSTNGLVCALASVANGYELDERYCINGKALSDSLAYASKDGTKTAKFGDVRVTCNKEKQMCFVYNFYLPQKDVDDAFVQAFSDPKYLIYYEIFPAGEEKAWTMNRPLSYRAVLLSGGLNVIMGSVLSVGGKVAKGAGKKLVEYVEGVSSKIFVRSVSKEGKGAMIEYLTKKIGNRKEIEGLIDGISRGDRKSIKKLAEYVSKNKITKEEAMEIILANTNKYTRDEIGKMIDSDLMEIAMKNMEIDVSKKSFSLKIISGKMREIREFFKRIKDSFQRDKENKYFKKHLSKKVNDAMKKYAMFLKKSPTLQYATVDALASAGKEIGIDDNLVESVEEFADCSIFAEIFSRNNNKFRIACAVIYMLSYNAVKEDMSNEKYRSHGFNTIWIYSPFIYLNSVFSFGKKAYPAYLPDSLEGYYLILDKDHNGVSDSDRRFYLASPCKATLVLKKVEFSQYADVCYAWKKSWEEIEREYKKEKRKIEKFLQEACIQGKNHPAQELCYCIPDGILKNIGVSEEEIYNRRIPYDKDECEEYLKNPKIYLYDPYAKDCYKMFNLDINNKGEFVEIDKLVDMYNDIREYASSHGVSELQIPREDFCGEEKICIPGTNICSSTGKIQFLKLGENTNEDWGPVIEQLKSKYHLILKYSSLKRVMEDFLPSYLGGCYENPLDEIQSDNGWKPAPDEEQILQTIISLYLQQQIERYGENKYKILMEKSYDEEIGIVKNIFKEEDENQGEKISMLNLGDLSFWGKVKLMLSDEIEVPSKAILIRVYKEKTGDKPNFCYYPDKSFSERYGGLVIGGIIEGAGLVMGGPIGERIASFISGAAVYMWEHKVEEGKRWPYGNGKGIKTVEELPKF